MVTPDKDYGQLVSEKVKIYKPGYQGGTVEIMGPDEVKKFNHNWNRETRNKMWSRHMRDGIVGNEKCGS